MTPEDSVKIFLNMTVYITTIGYRTRSFMARDLETLLYVEGPIFMWSDDESELGTHQSMMCSSYLIVFGILENISISLLDIKSVIT